MDWTSHSFDGVWLRHLARSLFTIVRRSRIQQQAGGIGRRPGTEIHAVEVVDVRRKGVAGEWRQSCQQAGPSHHVQSWLLLFLSLPKHVEPALSSCYFYLNNTLSKYHLQLQCLLVHNISKGCAIPFRLKPHSASFSCEMIQSAPPKVAPTSHLCTYPIISPIGSVSQGTKQ